MIVEDDQHFREVRWRRAFGYAMPLANAGDGAWAIESYGEGRSHFDEVW